jgi:hypothetical protein
MEEKIKFAVAVIGKESKVGSLFISLVGVNSNFFRENHIPDDKGRVFNLITQKAEHHYVFKYSAIDLLNKDIETLIQRGIAEAINTVKEFWKHDIEIEYHSFTIVPFNKRVREILVKENWEPKLVDKSVSKVGMLARTIGEFLQEEEQKEIKVIYGTTEYDKLGNCPHIR